MNFKELSVYLQKLEGTSSRNSIIEILAELYRETTAGEIREVTYLLQGRVAPIYVDLEFGMADKMVLKALSKAYAITEEEVRAENKKKGDIGQVAEALAEKHTHSKKELSISHVFETLKKIAESGGAGSVEVKIDLLSELLKDSDVLSTRYVARIPVGNLRLGFSDMTVLDALSWSIAGTKEHRKELETAFNVRPDLGLIAESVKKHGVKGVAEIKPAVFNPILMARAERLSSGEEIIEKIGKCALEPKFDGFRLQVHVKKVQSSKLKVKSEGKNSKFEIKLYTRGLEDVTFMYPDVVEGIEKQLDVEEAIIEGEALAYDRKTDAFLPFQITTQRKRKYGIPEMAEKYPLRLMTFELLYLNGKPTLYEPYEERRQKLSKLIKKGNTLRLSPGAETDDPKVLETMFDEYLTQGLEGIMAKRLDGAYQAGARGWNWIKLKRSYSASALNDTIDALVMGYYAGRGKRTDFGIGGFLIGVYDKKQDKFVTVSKVGTGLTDDEWRELKKRSDKIKAKEKPPLYEVDKALVPDVWVEPEIIVEIRADELTRSPNHTAGRIMKASKSGSAQDVETPGYALRFPRLEKFRDDKKIEDATSIKEIEEMFEKQGKK